MGATKSRSRKRGTAKRKPRARKTVSRKAGRPAALPAESHSTLLRNIPQKLYCTDLRGRVIYANRQYCRAVGRPLKEILGKTAYDFFPKDLADKYTRDDRRVIRTGRALAVEEINKPPGQAATHVRVVKVPLRDPRGRIIGVQGIYWDVSEQRQTAAQLQETEQRLAEQSYFLATLMDTTADYIYFKDARSRFILNSRAHARLLGLDDPAQAVGRTDFDFFPREQAEQFLRDEQRIIRTGRSIVGKEEQARSRGGDVVWVSTSKMPLRDAKGSIVGTLGVSRDITDRKRAEETLHQRAFYDPLTGLPNRALFMDRLAHLFRRTERRPEAVFAVLFLDLDRFKAVNDSLGHQAGDALLVATAKRLELCVRPGDTVARLGGDEFTVLLEEVRNVSDAVRVADRIHAAFLIPMRVAETEIFTTTSIGIALSTGEYSRPEDILRDADTAMYGAKAHGRARYEVFDKSMHDRAVMLLETETGLRRALERNELRVYYHPIVRIADRRILGFGALVRWQHPQRGLLLPDQFITAAEEVNLMGAVGLWVLQEACRQTRDWQLRYPSDPPRRVSVNVSSWQLHQKGFLQQVRWTLERTGLAPRCLTLEVTEQTLVENLKKTAAVLAQLRSMAVQVHIDNFGTGHSLLQDLRQHPADVVKVDRSLMKMVGTDEVHAEVLRTIVRLAQSVGLRVTAEGVETKEQLDQLRDLECGTAQGFLSSQPLDAAAAEALLAKGGVWNADAASK